MPTEVLSAQEKASVDRAAQVLKEGGLVAFPTDTVYGVGAHAFLPQAIGKLYVAKRRPRGKPVALLLANSEDVRQVAENVPQTAWRLSRRFWPGGLTLVVPRGKLVPDVVCAKGETIAVRVPNHPVALALIEAVGAPLAATSANLSGHPDPLTAEDVQRELGGRIDLILDGGRCPGGIASTVLDLTTAPPAILRPGAIPEAEIREALRSQS